MIDRPSGGCDLGIAAAASGWITILLVADRWSDLLAQTRPDEPSTSTTGCWVTR